MLGSIGAAAGAAQAVTERIVRASQRVWCVSGSIGLEAPVAEPVVEVEVRLVVILVVGD